jgi:hypothetical protein
MTAPQVASHLRAKKTGRDKWIALCPAHPDRKPSLSITAGKSWVLLKCWSHGCDTNDILSAAGLSMSDLSYSPRTTDPERLKEFARKRYEEEEAELALRRQDLQGMLKMVNRNPVRTQSTFDRDIEAFTERLDTQQAKPSS